MQDVDYLELLTEPLDSPPPSQPPMMLTWAQVGKVFGSVKWCWPGWIPKGHVTLLTGPQGVGKSFLAAHLIACLTGGLETWPDGVPCDTAGNVLLLETEQMRGPYHERLTAAGAKVNRVFHYCDDPFAVVQLPRDLKAVLERAQFINAVAVVLDSLSGGNNLDENSAEMRHLLQGLAALAAQLNAPVIGVHHLRKRSQFEPDKPSLDRVRGSSTITQFARSVLGLWRPGGSIDGPVRIEPLKATFCKPSEAFGFTIDDGGRLQFQDAPEEERPGSERERAEAFLLGMLKDGPRSAAALREDAELAGYSWGTVQRAKNALGIVSVRRESGWLWSLPVRVP